MTLYVALVKLKQSNIRCCWSCNLKWYSDLEICIGVGKAQKQYHVLLKSGNLKCRAHRISKNITKDFTCCPYTIDIILNMPCVWNNKWQNGVHCNLSCRYFSVGNQARDIPRSDAFSNVDPNNIGSNGRWWMWQPNFTLSYLTLCLCHAVWWVMTYVRGISGIDLIAAINSK